MILLSALFSFGKEYEVKVGEFSKLKVTDSINIVHKCVNAQDEHKSGTAWFDTNEDLADAFIFSNKGETLRIIISTEDAGKPGLPTIYLYSNFLVDVENGGLGEITIEDPAPCAKFNAKVIGNGSIVVKNLKTSFCKAFVDTGCGSIVIDGNTVKGEYRLVGTGLIQADRLKASEVVCKIMGSGSIGCDPADKLTVKGIGSTKIYYKGTPQIKKIGGGNLINIK